jgi:RHS repeat-associated protein
VFGGAATQLIWNTKPSLSLLIKTGSTSIINGPNGLPEEQITSGGTRYYYHQDQIGSTVALSDSGGNQVQTYAYDPYGNLTSSSGSITNPFQFQGQFLDAATGLYYLRARFYDPVASSFLAHDPVGRITRTAYAFVADDPVNRLDPMGLDGTDPVTAGGEAAYDHVIELILDAAKAAPGIPGAGTISRTIHILDLASETRNALQKCGVLKSRTDRDLCAIHILLINYGISGPFVAGCATVGAAIGGVLGGVVGAAIGQNVTDGLDRDAVVATNFADWHLADLALYSATTSSWGTSRIASREQFAVTSDDVVRVQFEIGHSGGSS